MPEAFLGLGSNLGDREANLKEALSRLAADGLHLVRVSSIYESAAILLAGQPDFLNLVACVRSDLDPSSLLRECLGVEAAMGRVRGERWGPRNIDIDLLLYNGLRIQQSNLTIPHPGIKARAFVIIPLLEISPDVSLPGGELLRDNLPSEKMGSVKLVLPPPQVDTWGQ